MGVGQHDVVVGDKLEISPKLGTRSRKKPTRDVKAQTRQGL